MKRLLPYFRLLLLVKWQFLAGVSFALVYGAASGFGIGYAVREVFPVLFGDEGRPAPDDAVVIAAVVLLPTVMLIRALSGFFNDFLIAYCGIRVLEALRTRLFGKLQTLPLSYFQVRNKGDLMSRIMSDTAVLQATIAGASNDLLKQPATFLSAIGLLLYLALQNEQIVFVLFSLMLVPVCIFPIHYVGKKIFRKAKAMQQETGGVTECINENLGAVREVRAFNLEGQQEEKFGRAVAALIRHQVKVVKYQKMLSPTIEFVASLGVAAAVFYAAKAQLDLAERDIVALLLALHMSYDPIKRLGAIHNNVKKGMASLERIEEVMDAPDTVTSRPGAVVLPPGSARGEIGFQGVTFSYGEAPVLEDVNCTLEAGRVYALVGPTGAGKSTFVNLTMRLYDVTGGRITLDGTDLREIELKSLRDQFALVPQDPVLFNDTIFNNILLSRPDASREEVYAAARRAFAHEFITEVCGDGYDTVVGDKGTRLSGGQKQRIAIARAYLKEAPVLILDEITSALDAESESKIQLALQDLAHGRTVIMIAHRFSTIKIADEILVFKAGQLTGVGPHERLMESNEIYRDLYTRQMEPHR